MPWANLDDQFPDHPKVVNLSHGAFRLHVAGICHSSRYLTDGRIDACVVPRLIPNYSKAMLSELTKRGIWLQVDDSYEIHDYLEWNRSRSEVLAERERKSKGGKKGADARWHKP